MEALMLDLMYEIPSRDDIKKVVINEESLEDKGKIEFVLKKGKKLLESK
jgi:ATP-dependent Clp protease ATP-binding subunit ClpX